MGQSNPNKIFEYEGKKVLLKKVITPKHLARYSQILTKVKKDTIITITGYPGEGKSVLAREISKSFDKNYNDDRNCIYERKELIHKIESFRPSAFILDEAINLLYKRDWNTTGQKELIKALNICRSKRHFLIFVQPSFSDMDKDIRNYRIRLWIYVVTRGIGVVFIPNLSITGTEDPWNLKENDILIKKYVKIYGRVIGCLEGAYRSKNFLAFIRWQDISKEEYQAYEQIKDQKKFKQEQEQVFTKEELVKNAIDETIRNIVLLEANEKVKLGWKDIIATSFNLPRSSIDSLTKKHRIAAGLIKEKVKESNNLKITEEDMGTIL